VNPKSYKKFKADIAEEVGVHPDVVNDFINFYYGKVRKSLSALDYPKILLDGLGTFYIRKNKLEKAIQKNQDILDNIKKTTYKGYEKSVNVGEKLNNMQNVLKTLNENIEEKKNFKNEKSK
tara:strand:+ start:2097 stop:2459 length:363 start_codon:yes stop_codon:yes gene_type:complete